MSELTTTPRSERREAVRYAHAIRQHWVLIATLVAVAVGVAFIYVTTTTKEYEASVDLAVTPVSANDEIFQGLSLFRQSVDGSSSVVTAARVFNSAEIRRPVYEKLGDRASGVVSFDVEPLSQADIVSITATAPSADGAADAANTFADTAVAQRSALFQSDLRAQIDRLERRLRAVPAAQREGNFEYAALAQRVGELRGFLGASDPTLRIVSRATPPDGPSWPRPKLTLAAAFLAALLLGCGVALLLEVANPRVSREDELQLEQRLPILARIPRLSSHAAEGYLVGKAQLPSSAWKGYRTLRAVLANAGPDGHFPRTIMITSASPGDGKTMTAVNLAITLAASDLRVILVDADLHRPMIASIFNVTTHSNGFASLITGRNTPSTALAPAPAHPRLRLLLSRREHLAQLQLLEPSRIHALLETLATEADVVVIDSPPVPEVAEALELAAAVDALVLAVRLGHTRRDRLNELRDMLARRGASPLGFVVTTRSRAEGESPYYYGGEVATTPPLVLDAEQHAADGAAARWVPDRARVARR
jgi:capsular exopolysaccharide synthesis family protein